MQKGKLMTDRSLVDVLLVRLVRDEEKSKVRQLLIKDAGITEEDAERFVNTTPCMISSGMKIQAARELQNKMSPYIDILPRAYSDGSSITDESKPETPEEITLETDDSHDDDFSHSYTGIADDDDEDIEIEEIEISEDTNDNDSGDTEDPPDSDEDLIITSASEEVLSIERCHVCGRTPTDVQKLAPCRTCGGRTCADCFDRVLHVCHKCAQEGKSVDRPIKDAPEHIKEKEQVEEEGYLEKGDDTGVDEPDEDTSGKDKKRSGKTALLAVLLFVVVIGYVLIEDPFKLGLPNSIPFLSTSPQTITVPQPIPPEDVQAASADTAAGVRQNDITVPGSLAGTLADSTIVVTDVTGVTPSDSTALQDSLQAEATSDTLEIETFQLGALTSLADIQIPRDYALLEVPTDPILLETSPLSNVEILVDSLEDILYPVTIIASTVPIEIDYFSFVLMQDSTHVVLMSILHPETLENRMRLVSRTAAVLDSTCVDQMVLYYKESQYHPTMLVSFMSESFDVISQNSSPAFIQQCQTYSPEIWDDINDRVLDWMTNGQ